MGNMDIQGRLNVSRRASIGGNASIGGELTVGHDLRVKGRVEARNIRGADKGLFSSPEALNAAYPDPEEGWYAAVGTRFPAQMWIVNGGDWINSGMLFTGPAMDIIGRADLEEVVDDSVTEAMNEYAEDLSGIKESLEGFVSSKEYKKFKSENEFNINNSRRYVIGVNVCGKEGYIRVSGASKFVSKGLVPYLFRLVKKRNDFRHKYYEDSSPYNRRCPVKKGWNVWGNHNSVKVEDGKLNFSLKPGDELHKEANIWTTGTQALARMSHYVSKSGEEYERLAWGRKPIVLSGGDIEPRMLRMRLGVAYGPMVLEPRMEDMVTNLAEFSLVGMPVYNRFRRKWEWHWHFSK